MRDPDTGAGSHHRLERSHETARRMHDLDRVTVLLVNVGLAIRDDDDALTRKRRRQRLAQALTRPAERGSCLRRPDSCSASSRTSRMSGAKSARSPAGVRTTTSLLRQAPTITTSMNAPKAPKTGARAIEPLLHVGRHGRS